MLLENIRQDVRYAIRGLGRNPGFAATAIGSLVLGIGASVAIFTVTDNLLLRPLPYRDPGRLMMVWERSMRKSGDQHNVVSPGNYFDWKRQNDVFEAVAGFRDVRSVLNDGSRTEELGKQLVSADLFPLLGVQPVRGRLFTAREDGPESDSALIISYRLWQSWFNGDENVIGRKVQINSTPRTIIGVMPPGFYLLNREIDLWDALGLNPAQDYRKTQGRWMLCVARLKPGVTRDAAQAHMTALAARLEAAYPAFDKNWSVTVEALRDSMVREVKSSLEILLGAVGLLLAVACANVANLLLARYAARRRELAVRLSLGAARARVIYQLLTESVLLGLAGGAGGVLAAKWAVRGLLALAPEDLVRGAHIAVDLRILLFAVVLSALTGVLFGMAPALAGSRGGLADGLRQSGRAHVGGAGRLRAWLVAGEVALSVMLLVGGMLLFRSFAGLQAVRPGIDADNVLTFRVSIPAARYREIPRRTQFFSTAIEQLQQLPGVRSASAVSYLPFDGDAAGTWVNIAGHPPARAGEELVGIIRTVMPGYFRAMGIPLQSGRDFTAADNEAGTPYRFIVNQAFAERYLKGEQPLGTEINALMGNGNPFGEIVGVVGDVKEGSVDQAPMPTVYYPYSHLSYTSMVFVVRTNGNPLTLSGAARRIIHGLDAEQPIAEVRSMQAIVAETFARQRFSALLLSGFSIAALLLAAVGIYGVLAYSVAERKREIGVRMALGARPSQIVGMVVGAGARLAALGTMAGVAGAWALSGLLKGLLFGIGPRDTATYLAVPLLLAAVALAAAYLPARRAALLEPMESLRE